MNLLLQFKPTTLVRLITFAVTCFAFSLRVQAQLSPAPDGGYPNDNTAEGTNALFSLTTGTDNTATGFRALFHNTGGITSDDGSKNTATGSMALFHNTTGYGNTANGFKALFTNNTGIENTANGDQALVNNTTGSFNTATGDGALDFNTNGSNNTANGSSALSSNTHGHGNTATGLFALYFNSTGNFNTANGALALWGDEFNYSTGSNNTANGYQALYSYTTGGSNTANGVAALGSNTTGNFNTANGRNALNKNTTASNNTADGYQALLNNTGSNNIGLGANAGKNLTTGDNNIDIGGPGAAGESNTIRIGKSGAQTKAVIQGISGATVANGVGVIVNSKGQLGTVLSAERFKDEIKPMDRASEAIMALKPVTFRYKQELDPEGIPQFGLVAEEVEKVNPDLVARDDQGKIYTVRYEAVNAMLLNEFLKEHRTVQELKKEIAALTATVQKVTAQVEMSRPAPQTVVNNH